MDLSKFTENSQKTLALAQSSALKHSHQTVDAEHLLDALCRGDSNSPGLVSRLLERMEIEQSQISSELDALLKKIPSVSGPGASSSSLRLSSRLGKLLLEAEEEAKKLGDEYVSVEHLFLALLSEKNSSLSGFFKTLKIKRNSFLQALKSVRGNQRVRSSNPEASYDALEKYGRDLVLEAKNNRLDPVIGRDAEIRRIIRILSRKTKNNPVLIGEPGVGKTAIAEGLAQRIHRGDVPEGLKDRTVFSLDLSSVIAGAKFKGEFEERLKAVLKEVKDADGQIILFIDELHTIVGAGRSDGAMDAGNILKPMLARGELSCIGATTLDEYRRYIEKDAALERRFQPVMVEQPGVEDTISILRGLKERFEVHHGVKILDSAIVSAAMLSDRYISDRFLPDKAIDLIDEACAMIRTEIDSMPAELDEVTRRVMLLEIEEAALKKETDTASTLRLEKLKKELAETKAQADLMKAQWESEKNELKGVQGIRSELERVKQEIEKAELNYKLDRAAELKHGVLPKLLAQLKEEESSTSDSGDDSEKLLREEVTENEIAEIVSKWTNIPLTKLVEGERQKLLHLEDDLAERVIGQQEAVSLVSDAVLRARAGVKDPRRPIGSFIFLGPTGVGKTELAKTLAASLFDSEESLIRIDMSEYMEKHAVSRLIGAPPGYVGYEDGGQLTEAVRRKPYSVILFDEIEKAHPEVFNILLQLLDDGRITDSQGRTVNFKNTAVIMTSNLGSGILIDGLDDSGEITKAAREEISSVLQQNFRPEFLNRVDETILFKPLGIAQIGRIVTLQLAEISSRLSEQNISIEADDDALEFISSNSYDPVYGARPLKRFLQRTVETNIAKGIIGGEIMPGDNLTLKIEEGELRVSKN